MPVKLILSDGMSFKGRDPCSTLRCLEVRVLRRFHREETLDQCLKD